MTSGAACPGWDGQCKGTGTCAVVWPQMACAWHSWFGLNQFGMGWIGLDWIGLTPRFGATIDQTDEPNADLVLGHHRFHSNASFFLFCVGPPNHCSAKEMRSGSDLRELDVRATSWACRGCHPCHMVLGAADVRAPLGSLFSHPCSRHQRPFLGMAQHAPA